MIMSNNQYRMYLHRLQRAILNGESEEHLYEILPYVNLYSNKIFPLEYYIQQTKSLYILSFDKKRLLKKGGTYDKCISICGEFNEKEYQKIYREEHSTNKKTKKYKYDHKERIFLYKLKECNIHGMCFCCGEQTFFVDTHHILGKNESNMTVSICQKCHYKYRGNTHCINIGNNIEKFFTNISL